MATLLVCLVISSRYLSVINMFMQTQLRINQDDLETGKYLGTGAFGAVFMGLWKSKDCKVAIKMVCCIPLSSSHPQTILVSILACSLLHHSKILMEC